KNSYLQFVQGKGDIPVVEIKNNQASARISLQGAHLLSWVPRGEEDVIWLSKAAQYSLGKSVRGGIPVCWPWFGAHKENSGYPAHGFARTVFWQPIKTQQLADDETQIIFSLQTQVQDTEALAENRIHKMWPYNTQLEYSISVGKTLKLELTTMNNSNETIEISEALHTYFNVGDVTQSCVHGLEGKTYLDKPDNFRPKKQAGPIEISEEVDRVYIDTVDDVEIKNKNRNIMIKKNGSQSTIVWNPWHEVARKMGDLGDAGYLQMLCVETANAVSNALIINAGERHTLSVELSLSR
ncbi:Aldose 1-epimerase family protein YeaD, partial [hydrothermal vent metagenome]